MDGLRPECRFKFALGVLSPIYSLCMCVYTKCTGCQWDVQQDTQYIYIYICVCGVCVCVCACVCVCVCVGMLYMWPYSSGSSWAAEWWGPPGWLMFQTF